MKEIIIGNWTITNDKGEYRVFYTFTEEEDNTPYHYGDFNSMEEAIQYISNNYTQKYRFG